jgi:stress response protein YsnF
MDERKASMHPLGVIELREERARVAVERVPAGVIVVRREVERRRERIEVELVRETLVVRREPTTTHDPAGAPRVVFDGRALEPGEEVRVTVYDESARAVVEAFLVETVAVSRVETRSAQALEVSLGREVLVMDQEGEAAVLER